MLITGPAGTGKSVVLRHIIAHMKQLYGPDSTAWAVLGSTGTSAIAVEGQTIHSFAGCGIPVLVKDFNKAWKKEKRKAWREVKVILLDEISMINGEFLDNLSDVVCGIRDQYSKPFGGIQLIFCGDFLQLPPIPKKSRDIQDSLRAGVNLTDIHCDRGFAFQSKVWRDASFENIILDEVFRQSNRDFINVLHGIRKGDLSPEGETFLQRCQRPLPPTETGIKRTILYCKNAQVTQENESELAKLPGEAHTFDAQDDIRVYDSAANPSWAASTLRRNAFFRDCIAVKEITLKVGAQVMLIKNEIARSKNSLVNGSRGKVVGFSTDASGDDLKSDATKGVIPVAVDETASMWGIKYPIVEFRNGLTKVIHPVEFTCRLAGIGECVRQAVPLKLVWALTVHKSQGMTLDYVKVDLQGAFAEAQVYVALSRASDENGLELRNFNRRLIKTHRQALDFYADPMARFPLWNGSLDSAGLLETESKQMPATIPKPIPGCFAGLSFAFRGVLKSCSRGEAADFVKACGGVMGSAGRGVSQVLVTGEVIKDDRKICTGEKYCNAMGLPVTWNESELTVIGEREFFALVASRAGKRPVDDCRSS